MSLAVIDGWMEGCERFTRRVNRWFLTLAGVFTAAILAVITYDLILRNVFDAPTLWALDASRFLLVFAVFFAMSPALEDGSHVAVDLVEQMLPPRARYRMKILAMILLLVFAGFLLWQITRTTIEAFQDDSAFPTVIPVKLKWIYWVGPLGMLQFVLTALVMLGAALRTRPHG